MSQARRAEVVAWARRAPRQSVDALLTNMASMSLRDTSLTRSCSWLPSEHDTVTCKVVVQSEHPYRPSTDFFQKVSFPGAPHIRLQFDQRTSTESVQDYVTLYTDDT